MKGSWRTAVFSAAALALLALNLGAAPGTADKTKGKDRLSVPSVFAKKAPEGIQDLETIQEHVKKVLKKVLPATVGIRIGGSAGSGVIIDAEGHVLTAGHVSGKPGQNCTVILPDGTPLKAKSLGCNNGIDSGLIKITQKGKWPSVSMGDSSMVHPSQWVLSLGHPGGFKKGRTPVFRLGRVVVANDRLIQTDCALVGGDSGGPLFDMKGKVIGIHSRIGPNIAANIHVPVNTYRETWDRLVKSESWGGRGFGRGGRGRRGDESRPSDAYLGVKFARPGDDLKVLEVTPGGPAAEAGLKDGDLILAFDDIRLKTRIDLLTLMQKKKAGEVVVVTVERGDEEVKVKMTLGKRPPD